MHIIYAITVGMCNVHKNANIKLNIHHTSNIYILLECAVQWTKQTTHHRYTRSDYAVCFIWGNYSVKVSL